jgi:hypothetical protein
MKRNGKKTQQPATEPMAMLANDHHPGPRCSCRDCLRTHRVIEPMADVEDAASILKFLSVVQPLSGVEYAGDERMAHGDRLIREHAARMLTDVEEPTRPHEQDLYEIANVLYVLHNVEPIQSRSFNLGEVHLGFCKIMEWIEDRLLRASGFDQERPHRTYGEKFNAALASNPTMPVEKLHVLAGGKPVSSEIAEHLRRERGGAEEVSHG